MSMKFEMSDAAKKGSAILIDLLDLDVKPTIVRTAGRGCILIYKTPPFELKFSLDANGDDCFLRALADGDSVLRAEFKVSSMERVRDLVEATKDE